MTPVVGARFTRALPQRLLAKARETLTSYSVKHTEVFSLDLISDVCEFGSRNKSFVITRFTQLRVCVLCVLELRLGVYMYDKSKWERFAPQTRFNMDEVGLAFGLHNKQTWTWTFPDERLARRGVSIAGGRRAALPR